ncbi:MAG: antitoxin component YwqK of YwqJK toxin-antitoxin module [Flavobacteriales bacterium]
MGVNVESKFLIPRTMTKHCPQIIKHAVALVLVCTAIAASALASSGKDLNTIDDSGLRQGYWIIKGYMLSSNAYDPNSTFEEGEYLNNKKEGLWTRFWPNGNLKSEIHYDRNRPSGAYSVYYNTGQMEERGLWDKNKNIGEFKRWHSNGNLQQEFYFSDSGKRNGIQKYFHENGIVELEVNIVNGKESGVMKRFLEDGTLKEEKVLQDGVLLEGSIKKHNDAKVAKKKPTKSHVEKINQVEDTPESEVTEDIPNDAFQFKPNGENILYDASRQITQIGEFRNGRLWDGKWHRYNNNGILIRIEIYRNGKYLGTGVISDDE